MKNEHNLSIDRRNFIKNASMGFLGLALASGSAACRERPGRSGKKTGVALVGLGYYSRDLLGPALLETKETYLAGIVTGTPDKEKIWAEKYNIPGKNIYNYDNFDDLKNNGDIEIIYIVLPNSMHMEFTIRAAEAGKHVICEKPMAMNAQECRDMIDACNRNNVRLSIGYRMHFEPNTQEIIRMRREEDFGKVLQVTGGAGFYMPESMYDNWRMKDSMGGGAMMDMGVYPLNAARYITGLEPVSVTAQQFKTRPEVFTGVDEIASFQLDFPDRSVANLITGFHANFGHIRATAQKGWFGLEPFQAYGGIKGMSSNGPINFPQINQQAAQMDEVAVCIRENKPMRVPGEEGLLDMIVVDGIRESWANGGKRVMIDRNVRN
ncbi:MAG: Gfo/Idh/MocA family oxidoreductase [Cyclobacteriaceae bacterium]|nr:Gfo/Idh/MocA family oxidoreductase [Cyclobacteriaceae bacterium]